MWHFFHYLIYLLDVEPKKSDATLLRRKHRKDISMTEYVQLKLRDLSTKPWEEVLRSPLVRNYLLLIAFLILFFVSVFFYAVYQQYHQMRYSEIQY